MWPFTNTDRLLKAILTAQFCPIRLRSLLAERVDDMLIYAVTAAPPTATDVVSRELTVEVNGEALAVNALPGDATELGEFAFEQGAKVVLTLIDVDDAGNHSQPAVLEFVAEDTIPPAQPGGFGVTLVREE